MVSFNVPNKVGESTVVRTRETTLTITLNIDGETFQILIEGDIHKSSLTRKNMVGFVEGMLEDDLSLYAIRMEKSS
jgi:hypothetical protein